VTDPRQWSAVILIGVVIGVVMAALDVPDWSYPLAAVALIAGIVIYQRRERSAP
jgi:hypothetical protein